MRVIPNFVDTDAIRPADRNTAYRTEHHLGDRTVVMYAGNLGHSQSLDLLVGAARRHLHRHDLVYVVNGGGVRADELRDAADDMSNLVVVGYQPAERVPEVLATADVHVVLLKAGLGASSVPSKAWSALAAARFRSFSFSLIWTVPAPPAPVSASGNRALTSTAGHRDPRAPPTVAAMPPWPASFSYVLAYSAARVNHTS